MSKTFLKICQDTARAVTYHGELNSIDPSQPLQRTIIEAVRSTWEDIQKEYKDLSFMTKRASFTTTSEEETYPISTMVVAGDCAHIKDIFYRNKPLKFIPYADVPYISDDNPSYPQWYTIDTSFTTESDDVNVIFNLLNEATYDLEVVYRRKIQVLTEATEYPRIEEEHHNLIFYGAVLQVAAELGRNEIFNEYTTKYDKALGYFLRLKNPKKTRKPRRFI